ncbi:hypothetical protein NPIL_536031, partial [Nephila pilipes]
RGRRKSRSGAYIRFHHVCFTCQHDRRFGFTGEQFRYHRRIHAHLTHHGE